MTIVERLRTRPVSRRPAVSLPKAACAAVLLLVLGVAGLPSSALAESEVAAGTQKSDDADKQRLPSFDGRTLDGKPLSTSSFAGKRLLLFCFNPGVEQATAYAQALAKLAPERSRHNFAIAGVAMGLDPANARAFVAKLHLDFPIFDDSDGNIASRLSLQSPIALIGLDGEGTVGLVMFAANQAPAASATSVQARLREFLRIAAPGAAASGKLDQRPTAPPFEAERMDGSGKIRLADLSGKPVVLVFFQPTCSHCQAALRFFKSELARYPDNNRPVVLGVSMDSRESQVEETLESEKLDFFPVLRDPDHTIATAYGSFARVPDILFIDAAGRIDYRSFGWAEDHDPDLMRMHLARISGLKVPMILNRNGYSGNDVCAVCHDKEAAAWRFTDHSLAFDSLVTRGVDHDPKCVGCHVVGFGEHGGYSEDHSKDYLQNVGCENCHGSGGGHLATRPKAAETPVDYQQTCKRCHDPTHSLGFDYETFLPRISHAVLGALSDAERAKLVAGRDRPRDLLPTTSAIVGSSACKSCHEHEYDIWSRSAHARSVESLRKGRAEDRAECVRCHVTGYGRPGGFPGGGKVRSNTEMANVGCESCHGPGGDHIKDGGKHPAGIVKLGDKCDSCVILQICGTCHDDANDPGFRFGVAHKIEAQRHGPAGDAAASKSSTDN